MTLTSSFLQELDNAVANGSPGRRMHALWYATDMLTAGRYSEDDIWVFGEVIGHLAQEIEVAARAKLAARLAHSDNAPFDTIKRLAFDDAIEAADPVLRHSMRIDEASLVENARTKSQLHLLAIANRRVVTEAVTDVLVIRGNREVAHSLAANPGARFSNTGFLSLVKRSERDTILTELVGRRLDIPRHLFQQLIAKASDEVRHKLQSERPDMAAETGAFVATAAGALQAKFGPASKSYFEAKKTVAEMKRYGSFSETNIRNYALAHKQDETIAGLCLLCSLPADVVERALFDPSRETALMLAKALDFAWETTSALLFLGAPDHKITAGELDQLRDDFQQLSVATAQGVLQTFQSRKSEIAASGEQRRLPQRHTL